MASGVAASRVIYTLKRGNLSIYVGKVDDPMGYASAARSSWTQRKITIRADEILGNHRRSSRQSRLDLGMFISH
jgi:hypothetical protein